MTDTDKTPPTLAETLAAHAKWSHGEPGGVRANLTDAYLTRADLTGAYLINANLTGAYLTRADLTDACLTNANLTGAYLINANLTGANLTDDDGKQWRASGRARSWGSDYVGATVQAEDGHRRLRYGCEGWRTLDEWERVVVNLCKKHEPDNAARYEAEIRALIALCRTLDMKEQTND